MVETKRVQKLAGLGLIALSLGIGQPGFAQSGPDPVALIVKAGTPLNVALDVRVTIKQVGQRVSGTIVNPVYVYDRIVVPTGTRVLGVVAQLNDPPVGRKVQSILAGDLTPARGVVLVFDTLVIKDKTGSAGSEASELPIQTTVTGAEVNVIRLVAGGSKTESSENPVASRVRDEAAQARESVTQGVKNALSAIKRPGKTQRLKEAVMGRLPYHRQYLAKGTVYTARLESPLDFGTVPAVDGAPEGAAPEPGSILSARLVTALDSAKTPRGTPVVAVITEPVFSSGHRLLFAAGTEIDGTVTFAKGAERFHRNGRLRFLFERVVTPTVDPRADPGTLLASLYSVQTSADQHVALDDEGGASIDNQKTRFVAPVLALAMLRASTHGHEEGAADQSRDLSRGVVEGAPGTGGSGVVGGFLGLGLAGAALSQISRPVGIALATVGVARTFYTNIFGKGREMSFAADTPIEVQLAPGPTTPNPTKTGQ
jgi:hypothetical protein